MCWPANPAVAGSSGKTMTEDADIDLWFPYTGMCTGTHTHRHTCTHENKEVKVNKNPITGTAKAGASL